MAGSSDRPEPLQAKDETVRAARTSPMVRTVRVSHGGRSHTAPRLVIGSAQGNDIVLEDPSVSRIHAELEATSEGLRVTDCGSTNGTRLGAVLLRGAAVVVTPPLEVQVGETMLYVEDGDRTFREEPPSMPGLVGRSSAMAALTSEIQQLQRVDTSVLLLGESGTGKELVARALHEGHARRGKPFVVVDCGALAPHLVASELFGHERGAFTGADRRHAGAFERASGGTLFLDELAELSPAMQASLLGVLERRTVRRVGGTADVPIDVRVVAATNENLRQAVNEKRFRLDLFHRIAVVVVKLPPLRERRDDIPLLVEHFLRELGETAPLSSVVSRAALRALVDRSWPGNVRELRNAVEAHLALRRDEPAAEPELPAAPGPTLELRAALERPYRDARRELLDEFERAYLLALLARCGGNVRGAAREARMDRSYLMELLERHGITR